MSIEHAIVCNICNQRIKTADVDLAFEQKQDGDATHFRGVAENEYLGAHVHVCKTCVKMIRSRGNNTNSKVPKEQQSA